MKTTGVAQSLSRNIVFLGDRAEERTDRRSTNRRDLAVKGQSRNPVCTIRKQSGRNSIHANLAFRYYAAPLFEKPSDAAEPKVT